MHVTGGGSLAQTALRARELGLAEVGAVAVLKRLRTAGPWREAMTRRLLTKHAQRGGKEPN